MRREYRERAPRVSDPDMYHCTCVTHVPWCMSGSLTSRVFSKVSGGENVPGPLRRMRNQQLYISGERSMWFVWKEKTPYLLELDMLIVRYALSCNLASFQLDIDSQLVLTVWYHDYFKTMLRHLMGFLNLRIFGKHLNWSTAKFEAPP